MTISSKLVMLDTNVLVYAYNADAPEHKTSRAVIERGSIGSLVVCVCPQVLLEFFVAVTNQKRVKNACSIAQAILIVEELAAALPLVYPPGDLHVRVLEYYRSGEPFGRTQVYDLAIAATMAANSVIHVCTFDGAFSRIPGVTVLTP